MSAPEGQANAQTPTTTDPAGVVFDFARSPDSSRTQPRTKVVEPAKSIRIRLPTGSASAKNERMHPSSRTRVHTVGVFVAEPLAPDRYVVVCGALTACRRRAMRRITPPTSLNTPPPPNRPP